MLVAFDSLKLTKQKLELPLLNMTKATPLQVVLREVSFQYFFHDFLQKTFAELYIES